MTDRPTPSMTPSTTETFTIGVFKDIAWATRGLDALLNQGFPSESISIIARDSEDAAALATRLSGRAGEVLDLPALGQCVASGPLVAALESDTHELTRKGLAASLRLAGFQAHDGRIFETLAERGGILVAVRSEPRAADALATLHAYGGGNAAIGAWHGRV